MRGGRWGTWRVWGIVWMRRLGPGERRHGGGMWAWRRGCEGWADVHEMELRASWRSAIERANLRMGTGGHCVYILL